MSTTLLPCPFCGSLDLKTFKGGDKEYVQCQSCTSCGPDHENGLHWNKRISHENVQ